MDNGRGDFLSINIARARTEALFASGNGGLLLAVNIVRWRTAANFRLGKSFGKTSSSESSTAKS